MKETLKEFKEFISRGNILDLAVGVVIGGAFGKIVTSMVDDIIMPLVGALTGGIDFTNLFKSLDGNEYASLTAAKESGAAVLTYGNFIQNVVNFLIIAFVIFMVIKQMARISALRKKEEIAEEATTKVCPFCKSEIDITATRCPHCTSDLTEEVL